MINTYAIVKLKNKMTPGMKAGYITDTLLDPHAANNNVPGQQMSIAGGILAPWPGRSSPIIKPSRRSAGVYSIDRRPGSGLLRAYSSHSSEMYNLWGQVPVKSNGPVVHYYNLTPSKVTHSGNTGIEFWYRNFIVPSLGDQAPLVQALQLNGQIDQAQVVSTASTGSGSSVSQAIAAHEERVYGPEQVVETSQPEFSGTAAPGSVVKLSLSPVAKPWEHSVAGTSQADSTGNWSLTTSHPLHNGQYRVIVSAFSRVLHTRPGLTIVPMQPLGRMVVQTTG